MRPTLLASALALCTVLSAGSAGAQSGGAYNLEWNSLTGGGQTFATGGAYALDGATGQHDAGRLVGGAYLLDGGFWVRDPATLVGSPALDPLPKVFAVRMHGSNPFSAGTAFQLDLPAPRRTRVAIYGVDGRLVRTLLDGERGAGRHTVAWDGAAADGRTAPPGVYFARVHAGEHARTLRLVRIH